MRETFALDVDGVVLDITPGSLEYVQQRYGITLTEDDVTDWDWDYIWSLPDGLSVEFWQHVWNMPARPYPGAQQFIEGLKDLGFRVVAISTRPRDWKGIGSLAREAAFRDFPQLDFDAIHLVDQHVDKVKVMIDERAKFIVEDNPKNALQCAIGSKARAFLITRPWNAKCLTVNKAWERVGSYEEILKLVHRR